MDRQHPNASPGGNLNSRQQSEHGEEAETTTVATQNGIGEIRAGVTGGISHEQFEFLLARIERVAQENEQRHCQMMQHLALIHTQRPSIPVTPNPWSPWTPLPLVLQPQGPGYPPFNGQIGGDGSSFQGAPHSQFQQPQQIFNHPIGLGLDLPEYGFSPVQTQLRAALNPLLHLPTVNYPQPHAGQEVRRGSDARQAALYSSQEQATENGTVFPAEVETTGFRPGVQEADASMSNAEASAALVQHGAEFESPRRDRVQEDHLDTRQSSPLSISQAFSPEGKTIAETSINSLNSREATINPFIDGVQRFISQQEYSSLDDLTKFPETNNVVETSNLTESTSAQINRPSTSDGALFIPGNEKTLAGQSNKVDNLTSRNANQESNQKGKKSSSNDSYMLSEGELGETRPEMAMTESEIDGDGDVSKESELEHEMIKRKTKRLIGRKSATTKSTFRQRISSGAPEAETFGSKSKTTLLAATSSEEDAQNTVSIARKKRKRKKCYGRSRKPRVEGEEEDSGTDSGTDLSYKNAFEEPPKVSTRTRSGIKYRDGYSHEENDSREITLKALMTSCWENPVEENGARETTTNLPKVSHENNQDEEIFTKESTSRIPKASQRKKSGGENVAREATPELPRPSHQECSEEEGISRETIPEIPKPSGRERSTVESPRGSPIIFKKGAQPWGIPIFHTNDENEISIVMRPRSVSEQIKAPSEGRSNAGTGVEPTPSQDSISPQANRLPHRGHVPRPRHLPAENEYQLERMGSPLSPISQSNSRHRNGFMYVKSSERQHNQKQTENVKRGELEEAFDLSSADPYSTSNRNLLDAAMVDSNSSQANKILQNRIINEVEALDEDTTTIPDLAASCELFTEQVDQVDFRALLGIKVIEESPQHESDNDIGNYGLIENAVLLNNQLSRTISSFGGGSGTPVGRFEDVDMRSYGKPQEEHRTISQQYGESNTLLRFKRSRENSQHMRGPPMIDPFGGRRLIALRSLEDAIEDRRRIERGQRLDSRSENKNRNNQRNKGNVKGQKRTHEVARGFQDGEAGDADGHRERNEKIRRIGFGVGEGNWDDDNNTTGGRASSHSSRQRGGMATADRRVVRRNSYSTCHDQEVQEQIRGIQRIFEDVRGRGNARGVRGGHRGRGGGRAGGSGGRSRQ